MSQRGAFLEDVHLTAEDGYSGYEAAVVEEGATLVRLARRRERVNEALVAPATFTVRIANMVAPQAAPIPTVLIKARISEDGRPVLVGLEISSYEGLDPTVVRRLPIPRLLKVATLEVTREVSRTAKDGMRIAHAGQSVHDELVAVRRSSHLPDELLMRVAATYRANPQTPAKAVHDDLKPVCAPSRATVGRYIAEARRRGFLGAATPRRAGEG